MGFRVRLALFAFLCGPLGDLQTVDMLRNVNQLPDIVSGLLIRLSEIALHCTVERNSCADTMEVYS